jgi:hypothetical protein
MENPRRMLRSSEQSMALVVVLAFIVLVTGLVAAFLSRTGTVRQIAHGSLITQKQISWPEAH